MFQVPEMGLFFSSLLIQLSGTSGVHWEVQGQKREGQIYKVIKYSILKPGLLFRLSVVCGLQILLEALQEHVHEHPIVLPAPWSWKSRQAI